MPDKHPNTVRHGGPGASHEDASKPPPEPSHEQAESGRPTNAKNSKVSTGGGERDIHHTQDPAYKS